MGCVTVRISDRTGCGIDADVAARNGVPAVSVVPVHTALSVNSENRNKLLLIEAACRNIAPAVTAGNRNTMLKVTVGLVCQVGLNYRIFYVDEGPFMVDDGYFKVK